MWDNGTAANYRCGRPFDLRVLDSALSGLCNLSALLSCLNNVVCCCCVRTLFLPYSYKFVEMVRTLFILFVKFTYVYVTYLCRFRVEKVFISVTFNG